MKKIIMVKQVAIVVMIMRTIVAKIVIIQLTIKKNLT